jgi:hypothetical protein
MIQTIIELDSATLTILKSSFELYEYKLHNSNYEYRLFLESKGWMKGSPTERRAIRVGKALYNSFSNCPHALSSIEPKVIYSLAQGRYTDVIEQLETYPISKIDQDLVLELMAESRHKQKRNSFPLNKIDENSNKYLKEIATITKQNVNEVLSNAIAQYHSLICKS